MKKRKVTKQVEMPNLARIEFTIQGDDCPLVVHNWSEKAVKEMLEKQTGTSVIAREPKNPEEQYKSSLYYMSNGTGEKPLYGMPAAGIKHAIIRAVSLSSLDLSMTAAKHVLFVLPDGREQKNFDVKIKEGTNEQGQAVYKPLELNFETDLVRIYGEPRMRSDMVRIGKGIPDIRFRAEFLDWKAKIRIEYDSDQIDDTQIATLLYRAGTSVGLCEGRPGKAALGWGRFKIVGDEQ